MAALTYRTSVAGGSTSGTGNRTVVITPSIRDLFIVMVAVAANTNATATCSDNNTGGTYTRITGGLFSASANYFTVFVRNEPLYNTTSTTITAATGSNTSGAIHVLAINNAIKYGASAVRQFAVLANQAAGGTPAPAFSIAALTGSLTLGCVANAATAANMTQPTGWTERQENAFSSGSCCLESVTRDSGFTGTTVTWGNASATAFGAAILELDGYENRPGFVMHSNGGIF